MIHSCTCKHDFQDEKYGKNQRVFNRMKGNTITEFKYRCTICLKEIIIPNK
jgi:hypothetical protein